MNYFRYDVLGCVIHDKVPFFSNDVFYCAPSPIEIRPLLFQSLQQLVQTSIEMAPLADAFQHISSLAHIINTNSRNSDFRVQEDDMTPLHLMLPVLHILLSMPRLETNFQHVDAIVYLREMTRLAMLVLLAAIKRAYSFTFAELDPLEERFSNLLFTFSSSLGTFFPNLQFWAVLTVAALRPQSKNRMLYVTQIRKQMNLLGIDSANAALETAKAMIWIDAVAGETLDQSLSHAIDGTLP